VGNRQHRVTIDHFQEQTMKVFHSLIVCAGLGFASLGLAGTAGAEPPPGHPTPDAAMRMMQPGGNDGSMRAGKVISHIDANEYTYVEVNEGGKSVWLAAPKVAVKDGDDIRFANGMVMRDFYSKLLKRTFAEVIFTGGVEVTAAH
jgi:hypothetical protein